MNGEPVFLELGAEGFWKTYGSYKVWDSAECKPVADIASIREHAPQILKPFERSMMLEYAWKDPFPSWLGVQVSVPVNDQYVFSEELYNELTRHLSQPKVEVNLYR